ncbi:MULTISPECIES: hypothetical protein [Sphingomonas]|uniref:Uncharacterized protein n=1 Tax=Sphingomonas molluscorum TaxID=418184 RepID=A0ABU8Q5V3_9SPHN|nr:hypothetical protein [Sphingomonas sp. JUb134]MBM7406605.1 hypothetical protein [Sphingomonas sp. JUb134]
MIVLPGIFSDAHPAPAGDTTICCYAVLEAPFKPGLSRADGSKRPLWDVSPALSEWMLKRVTLLSQFGLGIGFIRYGVDGPGCVGGWLIVLVSLMLLTLSILNDSKRPIAAVG